LERSEIDFADGNMAALPALINQTKNKLKEMSSQDPHKNNDRVHSL
jgi:hypothetical protein